MSRFLFLYFLLFSFVSCSSKESISPNISSNKKLFETEDFFILSALRLEQIGDFRSAKELYTKLYDKTNRKEYLYKILQNKIYMGEFQSVLDRLELLLHENKNDKKALKLQTIALLSLAQIYSKEDNMDAILVIYLKIYKITQNIQIAEKIVQIYKYQQKYLELLAFLEISHTNDKILLRLYIKFQRYREAYMLSYNIYLEENDLNYLAQSAIFEYESAKDKDDKELLASVVKKLKDVIEGNKREPLYLNYLGYILIDHNIDITQGIKYVEDALKIEPKSAFYLDSLAWGYYKLGNCKDAQKLMDDVLMLDDRDNEEVISHIEAIDRCLQKQRR